MFATPQRLDGGRWRLSGCGVRWLGSAISICRLTWLSGVVRRRLGTDWARLERPLGRRIGLTQRAFKALKWQRIRPRLRRRPCTSVAAPGSPFSGQSTRLRGRARCRGSRHRRPVAHAFPGDLDAPNSSRLPPAIRSPCRSAQTDNRRESRMAGFLFRLETKDGVPAEVPLGQSRPGRRS